MLPTKASIYHFTASQLVNVNLKQTCLYADTQITHHISHSSFWSSFCGADSDSLPNILLDQMLDQMADSEKLQHISLGILEIPT